MEDFMPMKLGKTKYFVKDMRFDVSTHSVEEDYPLHWHEFYELEYIIRGHAVQTVNGVDYEAGPGFAVLVSPSDLHAYKQVTRDDRLQVFNVKFSPVLLPEALQNALNGAAGPICGLCPEMESILNKMHWEYRAEGFCSEQYIISAITQVCILLFRCSESTARALRRTAKQSERQLLIGKTVTYIREHFLEPISVETVARVVHLTPNYFSEFFKKHMGIGFAAYVKQLRLEFAASLLLTSDLTVKQVADQSGFNSQAHFFNSFKTAFGVSPEQFRKNAAEKAEKAENTDKAGQ